jgi:hypothetical protein
LLASDQKLLFSGVSSMRAMLFLLTPAIAALATPALAQEVVPGGYVHEGFYLRASFGPGFHYATLEADREEFPALDASGPMIAGDLMVGGTPIPGLVTGGALMGDFAPNPRVTVEDREANGDYVESSAGYLMVFVDAYVDPRSGFHFGGAAGYMGHTLDDEDDPTDEEETHEGFGGAVWCGYDTWVAPRWSLGGMLRLNTGVGWHDVEREGVGVTEKATVTSVSLLFTGLYQ